MLLSNDPKATWFTDSHLSRMAKCSRKTAYNHITAWLADGRVEAKPSKTGWKRQVRRIVANRRTESESTDGAEPEIVSETANPYTVAVRQYGDRFIEILIALRDDENIEARVRFSAASCLSEFGCIVPGSEQITAPVMTEREKEVGEALAFVRETTSAEFNDMVVELSDRVRTQYGQDELNRVIKSSICGGQP